MAEALAVFVALALLHLLAIFLQGCHLKEPTSYTVRCPDYPQYDGTYTLRRGSKWEVGGSRTYWGDAALFLYWDVFGPGFIQSSDRFDEVQADPTSFYLPALVLQGPESYHEEDSGAGTSRDKDLFVEVHEGYHDVPDDPYVYGNGYDSRLNFPHCSFPIYEQGVCGNCYEVSLVGAASDSHCVWYGTDVQLDPQPLMSCSGLGEACCGSGAHTYSGMESLHQRILAWVRDNGLPEIAVEQVPRYWDCSCSDDAGYNGCAGCNQQQAGPRYHAPGATALFSHEDSVMKEWIQASGSVGACFFERHRFENFFETHPRGEVYMHPEDAQRDTTHCVRVVGWGSTDQCSYWVAANSWGSGWAEGGFFRISHATAGFHTTTAAWPNHDSLWQAIFISKPSLVTKTEPGHKAWKAAKLAASPSSNTSEGASTARSSWPATAGAEPPACTEQDATEPSWVGIQVLHLARAQHSQQFDVGAPLHEDGVGCDARLWHRGKWAKPHPQL